jgi:hypothetical protein
MSVVHQVQYAVSDPGLRFSCTAQENVEAAAYIDESIANGEVNKQVTINLPAAGLKFWAIVSDKDVTVKTNSAGSPQETWSLKAGKPLVWINGNVGSTPIAGPITALFVTNSSGSAAALKLLAGWDPTP